MNENLRGSCPLQALAGVIGGKWKIAILGHLRLGGPARPSELRRRIQGVSEKVLNQQISQLVQAGLVERRDHKTVPPHVDYRLSRKGTELSRLMGPLAEWSAANLTDASRGTESG